MENDDEKIEVIKMKVRNTLNLKNVSPDVKGWIEKRSTQQPPFRGHYYTPYELTADIKLVEDSSKRNTLIVWLRRQETPSFNKLSTTLKKSNDICHHPTVNRETNRPSS